MFFCVGSGDEGSDQEREWETQQIMKGVTGIQQVLCTINIASERETC